MQITPRIFTNGGGNGVLETYWLFLKNIAKVKEELKQKEITINQESQLL